jgi:predicted metal-dependent phosphoesterase TrpH
MNSPDPGTARCLPGTAYHWPVRIDLHVHSSASDGTDPPAEVVRRARERGVDTVALTDHDTASGHDEARRAAPPGLAVVPGMELSCLLDGQSVHMLAYLFDPGHPGLAAECGKIRGDRVRRARAMVERLVELGAGVTWDQVTAIAGGGVVGRPHIARALADAGVITEPAEAFTAEWIGDGGRAFVGRYAPTPARAAGLIRDAGGVSVLAHPRSGGYQVADEVIASLAAAGLTGVEVHHPDHGEAQRARLTALAADLGLVVTGGSDDHGRLTGHRIGCETTAPDAWERLAARAAGTVTAYGGQD